MNNAAHDVKIGMGMLAGMARGERQQFLARAAEAGVDRVVNWDHITFRGGWGTDGLIKSTTDCGLHPTIGVYVSVYLLLTRHPVTVARQLSSLSETAPGRLVLGVGIGGDDRHELVNCGVNPKTRGRRMEESLIILRRLLAGEEFSFAGEFFTLEDVSIKPVPDPAIPIIGGGRSDAAIQRAGRLADGWIGVWNSANRFVKATTMFQEEADRAGRPPTAWKHAMQIWCGIGGNREIGRERVTAGIESFLKLPFAQFEPYCAWGRPADIVEYLQPYLEVGCREFNFVTCAADPLEAADGIGEVKAALCS